MALEEDAEYIEPEQVIEEAVSEQVEEAVIEAQDGEMQIMAAASCPSYQMFSSNSAANAATQNCVDSSGSSGGFNGAEDFKAFFDFGSNANLGFDKNTGEIYIFPSNGAAPQATGYFKL